MIETTEPVIILSRAQFQSAISEAVRLALIASEKTQKPPDDELWDAKQAGEFLKIAEWTFANKTSRKRGFPNALMIGNRRRWSSSAVRKWAKDEASR